ncbi:MAG: epimerase [Myxococcota bacterium]
MTKSVLILGSSGRTGRHASRAFKAAGWEVRRFQRNVDDPSTASAGCQVIVNGMNPPHYHAWDRIVPEITELALTAARASGATVLLPGNVYNFGAEGGVWSEDTPHRPCTRKGRIRVEMEEAYRESGVRTIVLRAGNFIDPARQGDIMSYLLKDFRKGRVTRLGPSHIPQAWAYLPDWAHAAVGLAEQRDTLSTFEDVPFPGHTFSYEDLRRALEPISDRPLRLSPFPWWLMKLASPVWELGREMSEMRYLSDTPHELSGKKFSQLLPEFEATTLSTVMTAALPEVPRASKAQESVGV